MPPGGLPPGGLPPGGLPPGGALCLASFSCFSLAYKAGFFFFKAAACIVLSICHPGVKSLPLGPGSTSFSAMSSKAICSIFCCASCSLAYDPLSERHLPDVRSFETDCPCKPGYSKLSQLGSNVYPAVPLISLYLLLVPPIQLGAILVGRSVNQLVAFSRLPGASGASNPPSFIFTFSLRACSISCCSVILFIVSFLIDAGVLDQPSV